MKKKQKKMSSLQKKMRDDMVIANMSSSTRDCYARAVLLLSRYFGNASPAKLEDAEIRKYFVHLIDERKFASSTINQKYWGIRFFYETTLRCNYPVFKDFIPRKATNKIPVCLTHEEVKRILTAVRIEKHRVALILAYSCGLRVAELCTVQIQDILSGQGMLVVDGKSKKERCMPLPAQTLHLLRENYAASHPPKPWIFGNSDNSNHLNIATIQSVIKSVVRSCGVNPDASMHTLRHSYATTLLRNGIDVCTIQRWLGHQDPSTTMRYLHLTEQRKGDYIGIINDLMSDL